jgi:M6 family metalloprotease-like protein
VRLTGLLFALWICTLAVHGAYLHDVPMMVRQPDGTELHCFATGDEFYNWLHDSNGFTIVQDPVTGYYMYAEKKGERLVATSCLPGRDDPATAGLLAHAAISEREVNMLRTARPEYIPPARALAPRTGTLNNIVIFIRFSDDAEFTDPQSKYTNAFNVTTPGVNSMYNYFQEVSYGRLEVFTSFFPVNAGTTVLSYQDTQPRGYFLPYSTSNTIGYTSSDQYTRERDMLNRAVQAVTAQIPPGLVIDGDNDGYVDNTCFIVRGTPSAWATLLWPHMSSMGSSGPTLGTKKVGAYNLQIESMAGVNVLSHEMMHTLGAPDTYRYASPDAVAPTGAWDIMASTSSPPQHTGAYIRYRYLTWIPTMPRITASGRYSLKPVSSPTNNCYRIDSPNPGEFFVLEYRKRTSIFENSIPGEGLLVYRIDSLISGNSGGPPDGVYIYRPGGNPGTTWPQNGNLNAAAFSTLTRTAINDSTDPSCLLISGAPGNLDISGISALGDSISFTVTIKAGTPAWTRVAVTPANAVNGLSFADGKWGWIAGLSVLFRSTDAGTSWTNLSTRPLTTIYGVSSPDTLHCWAIGSSAIYKTANGGTTWETAFVTVPSGGRLYAIQMLSATTGWVAGSGGVLYRTTNGGTNWTLIPSGTGRLLRGLFFRDPAHGWALGDGGTMISTADSGASWSVWTFSDTLAFNAITFSDSLTGYAVGRYGRVYRTINGGALWSLQAIPTRSHLNAVAFQGHDRGWIAGDEGTVLRTTDGGSTWRGTVSGTMQSLKGIAVIDRQTQWIAGSAGTVLRSLSGPATSVPGSSDELPSDFVLAQNFPNPFNPGTTIGYTIPEGPSVRPSSGHRPVNLTVYDILGREVVVLVNERQVSGEHTVRFNATGLASGVYVYRLAVGGVAMARTMLLLK